MKNTTNGLQRFTDSKKKINNTLALKKIEKADIKDFTKSELAKLSKIATKKINQLTGAERDEYLNKMDCILSDDTKKQIWEHNHNEIIGSISRFVKEYGRMPLKNHIVSITGLSRQTVYKHLKEYTSHPQYIAHLNQFKFMEQALLSKVLKLALNGDIKAARLYFEVAGIFNQGKMNSTVIKQQNNFIQVNNTIISQANIEALKPEQLNQIENAIKSALP